MPREQGVQSVAVERFPQCWRQLWSHLGFNERWTCCRIVSSRRPQQSRAGVLGHIAQLLLDNLWDLGLNQVQRMPPFGSKRSRRTTIRGMTAEHSKPYLESGVDIQLLYDVTGWFCSWWCSPRSCRRSQNRSDDSTPQGRRRSQTLSWLQVLWSGLTSRVMMSLGPAQPRLDSGSPQQAGFPYQMLLQGFWAATPICPLQSVFAIP